MDWLEQCSDAGISSIGPKFRTQLYFIQKMFMDLHEIGWEQEYLDVAQNGKVAQHVDTKIKM